MKRIPPIDLGPLPISKLAVSALLLLALVLAACSRPGVPNVTTPGVASPTSAQPGETAAPTDTAAPPSPTPEPLAATVDGVGVTQAEYRAELSRYAAAVNREPTDEDRQRVLNDLIDGVLLAQAAAEAGFTLEDAALQARLEALAASLGGAANLESWMATNGYTQESFRTALARSLAAAWMRDQIAAEVPETAEQVRARQIITYERAAADEALGQLQSGADFATLATSFDPITLGDLGWFPRGYLPDRALEEAIFALQPGEHTAVIETSSGFHIVQVLQRDPARPLDAQARLALQTQAVQAWLEAQRASSNIQIVQN